VEKVLEWRSLQKLLNTYVDALPKQINSNTLRVHAEFNQAVASTGRLVVIILIYKTFQLEIQEEEKLEKHLSAIMKIILCFLLITPK